MLTPQEVGELFSVLRELKAAGKSIIIITHKLRETAEIADRVSVLRAGVMVDQGLSAAGCSASDLALMMVGRKVDLSYTRRSKSVGETAYPGAKPEPDRQGRAHPAGCGPGGP